MRRIQPLLAVLPLGLATMLASSNVAADEGQWMPSQISDLDFELMRARGLELTAVELWNASGDERTGGLMRAAVNLSGCTASFISPDGLIATNHHCAYSTIQANSPAFTQLALESVLGGFGRVFVAIALLFFAFTTLLAYYYIAETNVAYIRRTFKFPGELVLIKLMLLGAVFYGTIKTANLAWTLGDIGVGVMAWLNIIGILILFFMGKPAVKALRDYEEQRKAGVSEYSFDPDKLGIRNADFWKNN